MNDGTAVHLRQKSRGSLEGLLLNIKNMLKREIKSPIEYRGRLHFTGDILRIDFQPAKQERLTIPSGCRRLLRSRAPKI